MRIILKPLGVVVIGAALLGLSVMAVRGRQAGEPAPYVAALPSSPTVPVVTANLISDGVVYDDTLKNGWGNFSWAKHDLSDPKQSAPGMCIRVESKKFEAVAFNHAPTSVAPFDRVTFRIHGGDKGGQRLKLVAQYGTDEKIKSGSEHLLPVLTPGKWRTMTVTLEDLGVAGKTDLVGFWIQEGYGEMLPPYFVDDVRFLRPGETAPFR